MTDFDSIVIGSGIGGLACAAALTKVSHKVLWLEQHSVAGDLTQTFSRQAFKRDVGVHYLGDMDAHGTARAVLAWLCDGGIEFASMGAVYDTMHFPDGFEIQFSRPEAAIRWDLKEKFPNSIAEIDVFFAALRDAEQATRAMFTERAMPALLSKIYGWWHQVTIKKWCGRTTGEVLRELVSDAKLRAAVAAQRGDYSDPSEASSFGIHAVVMRHYLNGVSYRIGGAKVFAEALVPIIENGGGELKLRAHVDSLLVEQGAVSGV